MAETTVKKLPPEQMIRDLVVAFREAKAAAEKAGYNVEDGGTCNLDSASDANLRRSRSGDRPGQGA